jgi:hypothetical protein
MHIRHYQPGDEQAQAAIFNAAAGSLPKFKPATAEEIARRYRTSDTDPKSKFYAVAGDRIIGYAVFSPNGRISYPWCSAGSEEVRVPLLNAVLAALKDRGCKQAWAAYRGDWQPVLAFFGEQGFEKTREMINYVAEVASLPQKHIDKDQTMAPFTQTNVQDVMGLHPDLFADGNPELIGRFYFANPYFKASSVYALKEQAGGQLLGLGVTVIDPQYADPTKLDAAMPCFRLGVLGTENERHKRVNGLFSCVFTSEAVGETLLAEAVQRAKQASLTHLAAQAPSDQPELCAFYDRYFHRQGAFPIFTRRVGRADSAARGVKV